LNHLVVDVVFLNNSLNKGRSDLLTLLAKTGAPPKKLPLKRASLRPKTVLEFILRGLYLGEVNEGFTLHRERPDIPTPF